MGGQVSRIEGYLKLQRTYDNGSEHVVKDFGNHQHNACTFLRYQADDL